MASEETCIGGGYRRALQVKKPRRGHWSKARRTLFLKVLAETCNVTAAGRAVGTMTGAYRLRQRDPAFAQAWDEALAIGYDRLETMLLGRALTGVDVIDVAALAEESDAEAPAREGSGGDDGASTPAGRGTERPRRSQPGSALPREGLVRADVQLALALLNRRHDGGKATYNTPRRMMTSDQVDALLLKKLDSLARRLKGPA